MKVLITAINEIATISGDMDVLQHPLSDTLDFNEIKQVMQEYEEMFPQFKNLRFVARDEYTKQTGSRYGVTREWYDLVGDYKTELLGSLV
jgi:hypothetical protein